MKRKRQSAAIGAGMMMTLLPWLFLVVVVVVVHADIGTDHKCSVYTFLPFTNNGSAAVPLWSPGGNPGYAQMAAGLLAMDHFNQRNPSVIAELQNYTTCPIQLDLQFFDTGSTTHQAAKTLDTALPVKPCAIAGPFNDVPAVDLSVLAETKEIPLVAHRAFNQRVVSADAGSFSTQVYPDLQASADMAVQYLQSKGRTDYITILYSHSELGIQVRETLRTALLNADMDWHAERYINPLAARRTDELEHIPQALERAKKRGFRTLVVAMQDPVTELPALAAAAEALEMNTGDYVWLWFGAFEFSHLYTQDANIVKLLYGSAWMTALETLLPFETQDALYNALSLVNMTFVDRVNAANPMAPGQPGHVSATEPRYFIDHTELGQGFLYDAVMSIGMGACNAYYSQQQAVAVTPQQASLMNNDTTSNTATPPGNTTPVASTPISSRNHVQGIRQSLFVGASGLVRFENRGLYPGARWARGTWWAAVNILPTLPIAPHQNQLGSGIDFFIPAWGNWTATGGPYIYGDGTPNPPPLRDSPEENFLNGALRILGFFLLGLVLVTALGACIWVLLHKSHQVLRAAQPSFLYVLAFGSAFFSLGIVSLSFDESYGWTAQQLSIACMSTPWLISTGFVIIYGALFSKLYRVNKVLQFTRRRVNISDSIWPAIVLLLSAVLVLGLWTGLDPLQWHRIELNSFTGESIGRCESNNMAAFVAPLALVMVCPMVLTGWMAWKTRDVDDAYAESMWIFVLIVLQLEITLLGAPVIAILRTLSTNGRYVGFVIILWTFPMSTLILIMLPKIMALHRAKNGGSFATSSFKRGQRGNVRVSGLHPGGGAAAGQNLSMASAHSTSGIPATSTRFGNGSGHAPRTSSMQAHHNNNSSLHNNSSFHNSQTEQAPPPPSGNGGQEI